MQEPTDTISITPFFNKRRPYGVLFFACICCIFAVSLLLFCGTARAATLFRISDLISASSPAMYANHTLSFQLNQGVPASGKIVVTPQAGAFEIPADMSYEDIDVALSVVSSSGPFFDITLSDIADGATMSVRVVPGSAGSFEFVPGNSLSLDARSYIRIKIGTHADFGTVATRQILNPPTTGSFRMNIETFDAASSKIDDGVAMIAVVHPIVMTGTALDTDPPIRSAGSPQGSVPKQTTSTELTLQTDEYALCRYATAAGTPYAAMTAIFSRDAAGLLHSKVVFGLAAGTTYTFYVRCADTHGNANPDDYTIAFSSNVNVTTPIGGNVGQAFPAPPPLPQAVISGLSFPLAQITLLQNNTERQKVQTDQRGIFGVTLSGLNQGQQQFGIKATDSKGRSTPVRTVNLSVIAGRTTTVSGVITAPTIVLSAQSIKKGDPLTIAGESALNVSVEVLIYPNVPNVSAQDTIRKRISVKDSSQWKLDFDTTELVSAGDVYVVKARALKSDLEVSEFSEPVFFGIGKIPVIGDAKSKSDMNKDGKVNLVDFSILLFHWGTANEAADVNASGKVDLADFSILLFHWTG
jgi:hypothetical protein